jgi:hypothetical protein
VGQISRALCIARAQAVNVLTSKSGSTFLAAYFVLDEHLMGGVGCLQIHPAVNDEAANTIRRTIRRWRLHLWSGTPLTVIA